jgi:hypothetical protein
MQINKFEVYPDYEDNLRPIGDIRFIFALNSVRMYYNISDFDEKCKEPSNLKSSSRKIYRNKCSPLNIENMRKKQKNRRKKFINRRNFFQILHVIRIKGKFTGDLSEITRRFRKYLANLIFLVKNLQTQMFSPKH